jgi:hypothetical protein
MLDIPQYALLVEPRGYGSVVGADALGLAGRAAPFVGADNGLGAATFPAFTEFR